MAIRLDKDVLNEHAKFNKFDKYKQKPEVMQVADVSQKDIDARGLKTFKKYDLDTLKELGIVNPTLSEDELETLKIEKDVKPTGQFKKK
tara:strand:- start:364 stop:630 length:267 start_codon:yes stop_codon:yes gene_type:complete